MLGAFAVLGVAVVVLGSTGIGRIVGKAAEHFLLFYAGVFVLLTLTGTVIIGLVATDRIIMSPARRVTAQAVHRAVATGAMAFLVIHIVSEIAAQRSHVIDSVIPFLDPGRTFYLGLGTVASDLMVMIAVTGIFRARLASGMSPRAWRVLHATAYAAWLLAIVHGLLAGRPAKTFFGFSGFVAWSYGACVAAVGVALVVRFVAKDRAAGHTIAQPVPERATPLWPAGAGVPAALGQAALGQAGFGGAAPLAVSPARPYQRALPAGPNAVTAVASLSAGRGQPDDRVHFGQEEAPADYVPADYAYAPADYAPADYAYAPADYAPADYAYQDTRHGFSPGDARGGYAQGQARGGYAQDDPRGGYSQDDMGARYVQGDAGGGYGQDDLQARYGQDDMSARYVQDDVRGGYAQDDLRARYGQDDMRARYGQDDLRARYGQDDMSGRYVPGDVRGGYAQDDLQARYGQDDMSGRYVPGDAGGGYAPADLQARYRQDDMSGRYVPGDAGGGYAPADLRAGYGQDDMRSRYGQDDSRYGQDDMSGRYVPGDVRGGYAQDDLQASYAQEDMSGAYGPDDTLGRYAQDAARGFYGHDDRGGRFGPDDAAASEYDFPPGRDDDGEATGPLSAVPSGPFSRYEARS
jgi:DMSO/TMAO reductase YedYZ heme-binding membrane subunit